MGSSLRFTTFLMFAVLTNGQSTSTNAPDSAKTGNNQTSTVKTHTSQTATQKSLDQNTISKTPTVTSGSLQASVPSLLAISSSDVINTSPMQSTETLFGKETSDVTSIQSVSVVSSLNSRTANSLKSTTSILKNIPLTTPTYASSSSLPTTSVIVPIPSSSLVMSMSSVGTYMSSSMLTRASVLGVETTLAARINTTATSPVVKITSSVVPNVVNDTSRSISRERKSTTSIPIVIKTQSFANGTVMSSSIYIVNVSKSSMSPMSSFNVTSPILNSTMMSSSNVTSPILNSTMMSSSNVTLLISNSTVMSSFVNATASSAMPNITMTPSMLTSTVTSPMLTSTVTSPMLTSTVTSSMVTSTVTSSILASTVTSSMLASTVTPSILTSTMTSSMLTSPATSPMLTSIVTTSIPMTKAGASESFAVLNATASSTILKHTFSSTAMYDDTVTTVNASTTVRQGTLASSSSVGSTPETNFPVSSVTINSSFSSLISLIKPVVRTSSLSLPMSMMSPKTSQSVIMVPMTSVSKTTVLSSLTPTPAGDNEQEGNTAMIIYIVFGVVLGLAFLIGVVALIMRCHHERTAGMFHLANEEQLELSGFTGANKAHFQPGNFYGDLQMQSGEPGLGSGSNEPDRVLNGDTALDENRDGGGGGFGGGYLPEWKNLPTVDLSEAGRAEDESSTNTNLLLTYGNEKPEKENDLFKAKDSVSSYDNPSIDNEDGGESKVGLRDSNGN